MTERFLPIDVRYNFIINSPDHGIIGVFSQQCGEYGSGSDGLSWTVDPHRSDFQFRTQIFGGFPETYLYQEPHKMEVGRQYTARVQIYPDKAFFYLDDEMYYSAVLKPGDVALRGKIGFTKYSSEGSSVISNFEDQNNYSTMYAQILAGAGIGVQLLAFGAVSFTAFHVSHIIAFVLSLGALGTYIWAILKWLHAKEFPTRLTTYRSWKVNYVCFWVYVGVTLLNVILAYPYFTGTSLATLNAMSNFLVNTVAYIGIALGVPLVTVGIFLGSKIEQLWLTYDPDRSLDYEPFDYFIWEDEEPCKEPANIEIDTTINDEGEADTTETTETTNITDG